LALYIYFRISTLYLVCICFFFVIYIYLYIFQVIMAFKDPGFFNSVFPMLYEVSNQSVIFKTRASSSLTTSAADGQLFWALSN
jgi:hypothetical protein